MDTHTSSTQEHGLLAKAYQQVLNQRKVNTAMLRWSMNHRQAMKDRDATGHGVTLYLL